MTYFILFLEFITWCDSVSRMQTTTGYLKSSALQCFCITVNQKTRVHLRMSLAYSQLPCLLFFSVFFFQKRFFSLALSSQAFSSSSFKYWGHNDNVTISSLQWLLVINLSCVYVFAHACMQVHMEATGWLHVSSLCVPYFVTRFLVERCWYYQFDYTSLQDATGFLLSLSVLYSNYIIMHSISMHARHTNTGLHSSFKNWAIFPSCISDLIMVIRLVLLSDNEINNFFGPLIEK